MKLTRQWLTQHQPTQPKRWVAEFAKAGCNLYTFHYEAAVDSTAADTPFGKSDEKTSPEDMIRHIHSHNLLAGIAIKPGTPVDVLWDIFDTTDPLARPDVSIENENQSDDTMYENTARTNTDSPIPLLSDCRWLSS